MSTVKHRSYTLISCLAAAAVLSLDIAMLLYPNEIFTSAKAGLIMWYKYVLPILLPFIICSNMLVILGFPQIMGKALGSLTQRVFNLSPSTAFVLIIGMLSGYPLGAKLSCELYERGTISRSQAQRLLMFANNCGPLFIVGTLASAMLKSKHSGYLILCMHYLSALIIGIVSGISAPKVKQHKSSFIYTASLSELPQAVTSGSASIINVGCYIMLFSVILRLLECTGLINLMVYPLTECLSLVDDSGARGLVYGIFEMTNGCYYAASSRYALPVCAFLVSFGGLSVHAQSMTYILKARLNPVSYISAKLIQGLLAAALCELAVTIPCI